jgi:serine/threonine protein kinase
VCDILLAAECEELKVKRKEKKLMDSDFLPFIQHLDQAAPSWSVKIADFAISRRIEEGSRPSMTTCGTQEYMARLVLSIRYPALAHLVWRGICKVCAPFNSGIKGVR